MTTTADDPRVAEPDLPSGEIVLPAPPEVEDGEGSGGVLTHVIPMLGSLGSVAVLATMGSTSSAAQGRSLLAAGMFLVATVGFVVVQLDRHRAGRLRRADRARTSYLRRLGAVREVIRETARQQRDALLRLHPDPAALPALAAERSRVWERGASHAHALQVRYGVEDRPLSRNLVAPDPVASGRADPAAVRALHRLLAVHRTQSGLPATVDLRAVSRVEVCGTTEEARALARAMVCSAATFHSPADLVIAVLAGTDALAEWDWVKWLPHALSRWRSDAVGPRRLVATDLAELTSLLPRDEKQAHLLLVVDGAVVPPGGRPGVTVLDLSGRSAETDDNTVLRLPVDARTDRCDLATAEALARRLAPLRHAAGSGADPSTEVDLTDLLGLGDVRLFDPASAWGARPARDLLRVPIGLDDDGRPIHLDLKEAVQKGMGPHGLLVGATGSGKSELLRTLVLGLALTHSPEQLNLVLVDFKGGATFAGMSALPHLSALITNLADELALVDRMQDALSGELVRRQELLRAAGNHASVRDYERARTADADLEPLPSLVIVVDEFSELLSARPELLDLFVTIGRLGRSLGLHLLLASQRLEEGRLRGLESHLSYRIGLRTFSAQESRAVLGVPDAYELPPSPGLGFLQHDRSTLRRFTAAYVSGPPAARHVVRRAEPVGILPWTVTEVRPAGQPVPTEPEPAVPLDQGSLLSVAVAGMAGAGPAAHQIWLPPLDTPETLDRLMPDIEPDPQLGLVSKTWRTLGRLTVPVGTVDRPREQRREPLTVDLSGAGGHLAVVGAPRTGTSTLLRTLVTALTLTMTPTEAQFFVVDLGGGGFAALRGLPHFAGLGTRSEPDVVRRIVAEVRGIVEQRETYFASHGIDSVETYHGRRPEGLADDGYGEVFLVVDGWGALRADFDDLEAELQHLASRGLTYGVHLLTATARWADYRAAVRDLLGTRLELRLGDPVDSEIDRALAALVPPGRPGRGLVPGRWHVLTALPRIDGDPDPASLGVGTQQLVARISEAWPGPPGPKLRLLPDRLTADDLLGRAGRHLPTGRRLLLGVDERRLAPIGLDPDVEPHWLVFGDGGSGKSAALRGYLNEVMRTRSPEQAQIVVVDPRRSLLGEVSEEYLLDHLVSTTQATPALAELASYLVRRLPGPDVSPEQLRQRSWWTGPEVFVVVDDYDLVATAHSSPVQALVPLLAQARDVGLHLVVARRAGGASRALYEPVLQTLRDLATPGLVLSGSPEEGPLVGTVRPVPAPPGRGRLVTRERGVDVVQLTWKEPRL